MKPYTSLTIFIGCCLFPGILHAQQTGLPTDNIPQQPATPPATTLVYPALQDISGLSLFNFVKTQVPDVPLQTFPLNGSAYYRQTTQYFDGLGRPLQTVAQKAHADGYDIVQHYVYDSSGKETYQYLPFALPATLSTGKMSLPVNGRMHQFYDQVGPDDQPYTKTEYDHSPLNRVMKQWAPGAAWVGAGRAVTYDYGTNQDYYYWGNGTGAAGYCTKGSFPKYSIGNNPGDIPVYEGNYPPGQLYVNRVTDEDGKITEEAKDAQGRLIFRRSLFKKQEVPYPYVAPAAMFADNYIYTAYVYDHMNRLRYVLPPEACKPTVAFAVDGNLTTYTYSWPLSQAQVDGLCYQYVYDAKGRMIQQKVPGKETEYFVYDQRDRLVFSQDGNLRARNKWTFTVYDMLDRPICTGLYGFFEVYPDRIMMQGLMDDNSSYTTTSIFYYMKKYNLFQEYPASSATDYDALTYTYYDDYSYGALNAYTFDPAAFSGINIPGNGTVTAPVVSNHTRGLVTGSRVKVMDPANSTGNNWLTTANYYDDKGRQIQSISDNQKGGRDVSSNIYYFQGMLWKNILKHNNPEALQVPGTSDGPYTSLSLQKTFNRNLAMGGGNDQVYRVTQKIENGLTYNLAYYDYDHMGRVKVKQFPAAKILQEYNIRGFLQHIQAVNYNNYDPATSASDPHIFEENLYYDKGFTSKLYNGNIAGITWRKKGSAAPVEAYGYSYDGINRLKHAEYRRKDGSQWKNTNYDYTASNITYDRNGNLQSMNQEGVMGGSTSPVHMDQLSYQYTANSNQLKKVTDAITPSATAGLPDFKDNEDKTVEYTYDANGNMITDENKKISAITYNYLNKPEVITIEGGTITYVYDAVGNRLRKTVHTDNSSNPDEVYDYIGNFVYKNNELQYILNQEGRARPVNNDGATDFIYDYFIKDHLGNVRSTVTAKPMDMEYVAEHEVAAANIEQLIFDNIPNVRDGRPGGINPENTMAARLNGGVRGRKVGTAIMLKVMPGDRFDISVDAYYEPQAITAPDEISGDDVIGALVGALSGGTDYSGVPLSELPDNIKTVQGLLADPSLGSLLEQLQVNDEPSAPRAHLNYLFFNSKMELVGGSSGSVQVPTGTLDWTNLTAINNGAAGGGGSTQIAAPESGYVIVYIDNRTIGMDVWFDHLMIGHHTGEVIEENHYYPYGLTVQTDVAANAMENKYLYNGIGLTKDLNLEMYDAFYRDLDPQLGRFWQVDPKTQHRLSPYASMDNNPVAKIDPLGDTTIYYLPGETKPFLTLNDKSGLRVSIVAEGNRGAFIMGYALGLGGDPSDLNATTKYLNKFGSTYDVRNLEDFYEENWSKYPAKKLDHDPIDYDYNSDFEFNGKPVKLYAEVVANLVYGEDNIIRYGNTYTDYDMSSVWPEGLKREPRMTGSDIHIHPFGDAGQLTSKHKLQFGSIPGNVAGTFPVAGPSPKNEHGGGDYGKVGTWQTVRNVVIDSKNIYFYNSNPAQVIKIPR